MATLLNDVNGFLVAQQTLCMGFKDDGEPCGAHARRGSDFCYWHDPATEEERLSGLTRQERPKGSPILPEAVPLNTVDDVQALLRQLALYLATGERIEPRRATALNAVAGQLLKAIDIGEVQAQLAEAHEEIRGLQSRLETCQRELARIDGAAGAQLSGGKAQDGLPLMARADPGGVGH